MHLPQWLTKLLWSIVLVVVFVAVIFVAAIVLKFHAAEAPVPQGQTFHGPTDIPFVNGPSGPPPGSE
jgi:hypothetical protein